MKISSKKSILLLIDIQNKNINSIHHHEQLIANCKELIIICQRFSIPVLASQHIKEKNGDIVTELSKLLIKDNCFNKTEFSCYKKIHKKIQPYSQIILAGAETHICLLQTALDLLENNKQVFIVTDATNSRFDEDKATSLLRMQQNGAQLITKQMLLFELAITSKNPNFSYLSKKIMK